MFKIFEKTKTVTKTQTNVRLLLRDPDAEGNKFTRIVNTLLDGTMEVFTQETVYSREAGEIHLLPWYIGDMPSKGDSDIGTITMTGNPDLLSTGVIRQNVTGFDFPATLEAGVFQVLDIPGYGKLHNKYPVVVEAQVDTLPPYYAVARCPCALLFDEKDVAQGMVCGRALTFLGPA